MTFLNWYLKQETFNNKLEMLDWPTRMLWDNLTKIQGRILFLNINFYRSYEVFWGILCISFMVFLFLLWHERTLYIFYQFPCGGVILTNKVVDSVVLTHRYVICSWLVRNDYSMHIVTGELRFIHFSLFTWNKLH